MQIRTLLTTAIAAVSAANAADAAEIAYVTAFVGDLESNLAQYVSYIAAGSSVPADLLSFYEEVSSYTDDSYTTLIDEFPYAELTSWVTVLPWYSTRLSSELAAAVGTATAASSTTAASSSSSAAASSSSSVAVSTTLASSASSVVSSATKSASSVLAASSSASASTTVPSASASNGGSSLGNFITNGPTSLSLLVPLVALSAAVVLL